MIRYLVHLPDDRKVLAYANSLAEMQCIHGSNAWYQELNDLGDYAHLDRYYMNGSSGRNALAARAWKAKDIARRRGDLVIMHRVHLDAVAKALNNLNNSELVKRAKALLARRGVTGK
jgi:hypothetical protein